MADMPLGAQRHNNLALNRRLAVFAPRAELFVVVEVAVEAHPVVPAIVFCHLGFGLLVVVVLGGVLAAAGDALEAGAAVGGGLRVEGDVLEGGGAVVAAEAGGVEEGGGGCDDAAGDGEGAVGAGGGGVADGGEAGRVGGG